MHASDHFVFAALSLVVAGFGSWTALDLFRRVRAHVGRARHVWLAAAATALGCAIWAMHFIAMLGFDPGSPVRYDPGLTVLSLGLAIGATLGAFLTVARGEAGPVRTLAAGALMGAGICLMHYTGMAALRTAVSLGYEPGLVALSLAVAVAASTAALVAARQERSLLWRTIAAPILGAAIVGMHYTAMAALKLTPAAGAVIAAGQAGLPPLLMAAGVALGTLLILFLALAASLYDQRMNVLSALDAGGVGYWELTLPDNVLYASPQAKALFGRGPEESFTHAEFVEALTEEARARRESLLSRTFEAGRDLDAEYRLRGDPPRWINIRARVVRDGFGRPRRMLGVALDVTERQLAFQQVQESERKQRLLIDELNHRVKNTLATVQSIASQTARRAGDVESFSRTFEARLIALSRTHNALTQGGWERAGLKGLLQAELKPYAREQIALEGEEVQLDSRQALGLGMVFHEMATNAAKYGALSKPEGCVRVAWRVEPEADGRTLRLEWSESRGPAVRAPTRKGFGSRLIRGTVEQELGGEARFDYAKTGLVAELTVPLP